MQKKRREIKKPYHRVDSAFSHSSSSGASHLEEKNVSFRLRPLVSILQSAMVRSIPAAASPLLLVGLLLCASTWTQVRFFGGRETRFFPSSRGNTGGQRIVFFDWRGPLLVKITRSRPPCFRASLLDYGSRVFPLPLSLSLRGLKSSGANGNLLGHRERFSRNTADAGSSRA